MARRGPVHAGARRARAVILGTALGALSLLFVAPLAWMVSTSLKGEEEAISATPTWVPSRATAEGYRAILGAGDAPVLRWFVNSLVAAAVQALLVLLTATLAGYALARLEFAGKRLVFACIVGTMFVPPVIFLVPNFMVAGWLGWLDSIWAVAVPGAAGAFGVFFLRQFFLSFPPELEEAAALDGASRLQVLRHVVLPLSRPALATIALLSFLTNWNDFLWPLYVLFNPSQLTLPAGLAQLQSSYTTHYPAIMAGAVVAGLPPLLLFLVAQRYVIEGVSRTGLKG